MQEFKTKFSTKGQLSLPVSLVKTLNIKKGTIVKIKFDHKKNLKNQSIVIEIEPDPIEALVGVWQNKGYPTALERKAEIIQTEKDSGNYE